MEGEVAVPISTIGDENIFNNNSDLDLIRQVIDTKATTSTHRNQVNREGPPKIQRVPEIGKLRDPNLESYFKPSEIAIGPIHALKNPRLAKEDMKLRLTAKFLGYDEATGKNMFTIVRYEIDTLSRFFEESVVDPFNDDQLAQILFLDACSVLQFIHSYVNDELKEFGISKGQAGLIQQDLFLLENQIPFQPLERARTLSHEKDEYLRSIYDFFSLNVMSPPEYFYYRHSRFWVWGDDNPREPLHFLDFLRSVLLSSCSGDDETPLKSSSGLLLLYKHSFRNVQDLKLAGIKLKLSDSPSFRAISFPRGHFVTAQLKLPPLIVDSSTATKLYNLIAYEMCPDHYSCDFGVSSFLSFLNSLIDNEQDVRDLRAEHILQSRLSSDEEVAELFNTIGSNLVSDDTYLEVKMSIQKHYESRRATWIAQVSRDHFSSPWKILALVAALIALFLTGTSTWFTVYPSK